MIELFILPLTALLDIGDYHDNGKRKRSYFLIEKHVLSFASWLALFLMDP